MALPRLGHPLTGRGAETRVPLGLVLACFILVSGTLLLWGRGYPYGLDNNESYSSWWHARSLYHNGVGQTKGLTDEVFATHPEASPYIHSHQGNFPRLYTFALHALGARSIEAQVWITTFTVGLASILLAFRFLATLAGPRFAAAACVVMQTNYLLFAQWQVGLYNLWHAFFFFSSLLCVQTAGHPRRRLWFGLATLNFAALFYWEYVGTTFVVALCALYAVVAHRGRWRLVVAGAGAVSLGAALAGGTLLLQLVAYMGTDAVLEDIRLTLTARNVAADPELLARVAGFYAQHRIVFWHNFLDAAPLRTWEAFWSALQVHQFDYYSRPVQLALLPLVSGWLLGLARSAARPRLGAAGRPVLDVALAAAFLAAVGWGAQGLLAQAPGPVPGSAALNGPVGAVLVLAVGALLGLDRLYGRAPDGPGPGWRLAAFLAAALLAWAFTYRLFTGYVFSGYLHRLVPLLVFVTDLLPALGVWLLLARVRDRTVGSPLFGRLRAALALALLAALGWQWAAVQRQALALVPPDSYRFLRELDGPQYRGKSVVSNTYPAPMAARTGAWAYADTTLVNGYLTLTAEGFRVERDLKYLWFADRDTNPAYLRPDLAVLVRETPNLAEAEKFAVDRAAAAAGTAPFPRPALVRRATTPFQPFLRHRLLHSDGERAHLVGLDWDFPPHLRRRTDVREFAARLDLRERLALSAGSRRLRAPWRIEWEWLDLPPTEQDAARIDAGAEVIGLAATPFGREVRDVSDLALTLSRQAASSRLRLTVNDATEEFDLAEIPAEGFTFTWREDAPHGAFTRVPPLADGLHVRSRWAAPGIVEAAYGFAHPDGRPEAGTVARIYREEADGAWCLTDAITFLGEAAVPVRLSGFRAANPDTVREHAASVRRGDPRGYEQWLADHLAAHPEEWNRPGVVREASLRRGPPGGESVVHLPVPNPGSERVQVGVTPGTATKTGTEYSALPLGPSGDERPAAVPSSSSAELPFGRVHLRLRFPPNRWPQAEPILVTGRNEAGDVLYVIYTDERHIQLGYDHWFRGGPLTKPIPIDFNREHELEISFGSLFPPRDDLVFVDQPEEFVHRLKDRVVVRLNGTTVIDEAAAAYEADPRTVTVGRNDIRATSCNPVFFGEILAVRREWPDPR